MDHLSRLPSLSIFAIALALVIILPRLAERIKLPGIVGLLLGGYILGPHGLDILRHDSRVLNFFAEIGTLLLMFFAGFEIDPKKFATARNRALVYGFLSALFPLLCGIAVGRAVGYGWITSTLIGSLLASHTLLALPIVSAAGLMDRQSVIATVGATIVTDITAMLVLAICIPLFQTGFSPTALGIQLLELGIYVPVIIFGLSWVGHHALKRYGKTDEGRVAVQVLLIVIASQLAHAINLEGIVGAFLTGIALRRAVGSPQIAHTLESVSHALFIPAFFIATGKLIDPQASVQTFMQSPGLVLGIVGGLILSKFIAAWAFGAIFHYSKEEVRLSWSLSLPQVAATLAAAQVAFNTENSLGEKLIEAPVFDTILVLVLVTSVLGPVLTSRFAKTMPPKEMMDR